MNGNRNKTRREQGERVESIKEWSNLSPLAHKWKLLFQSFFFFVSLLFLCGWVHVGMMSVKKFWCNESDKCTYICTIHDREHFSSTLIYMYSFFKNKGHKQPKKERKRKSWKWISSLYWMTCNHSFLTITADRMKHSSDIYEVSSKKKQSRQRKIV